MFKLEKSKAQEFEFEFEGETYTVPAISNLPVNAFRAIRKAVNERGEEAMFDEIMDMFDKYCPDVMERITLDEAKQLFVAWSTGADGEPSLGES